MSQKVAPATSRGVGYAYTVNARMPARVTDAMRENKLLVAARRRARYVGWHEASPVRRGCWRSRLGRRRDGLVAVLRRADGGRAAAGRDVADQGRRGR